MALVRLFFWPITSHSRTKAKQIQINFENEPSKNHCYNTKPQLSRSRHVFIDLQGNYLLLNDLKRLQTCTWPLASNLVNSSYNGTSILNLAAFSRSFRSFFVKPRALEALSLASLNRCLKPLQASRTFRL